jgi:hypothetical protein
VQVIVERADKTNIPDIDKKKWVVLSATFLATTWQFQPPD